jgi:hypothetical protein
MKKQCRITALTILLLTAVLMNMSCNAPTQPTNNTVANVSNSNSNIPVSKESSSDSELEILVDENPDCDGNATDKLRKIKDGFKKNIKDQDIFKYQHNDYKKNFDFEVVGDGDKAILYIWGKVFLAKKDVNNFSKTFKHYVKARCVERVVFKKAPGVDVSPLLSPDFEYALCESPNKVCPDGSCAQDCVRKDDNRNTNSNTNVNSNSNSNSNTNSNSK